MSASLKEVKSQMKFIKELVKRLDEDIDSGEISGRAYMGTDNYKPSRVRDDVARIRRELTTLSKMTEWRWKE